EADHLHHRLSATSGCATYGLPATTPDDLLSRADRALLESKGHDEVAEPGSPPHDPHRRVTALGAFSRALALARDEGALLEIDVVHVADALRARTVEVWRPRRPGGPPALVARGHAARDRRPAHRPRPDPAAL